MQHKIDELKETSGNRDFSQGATTSGVTAASAIAALQEAGSKLSRDMIQGTYQAYESLCYMVIELIRQFYDEPRSFRVTKPNGEEEYSTFDNTDIRELETERGMYRKPVFDIKVRAQRKSPFQRISQNELAKELYSAGIFDPQNADQALQVLEMMDFEGKEGVVRRIQNNASLLKMVQELSQRVQELTSIVDAQNGTMLNQASQEEGLIPRRIPPAVPDIEVQEKANEPQKGKNKDEEVPKKGDVQNGQKQQVKVAKKGL